MLKLLSTAFKNIFRNKRRTVLTEIIIIFGITILILVNGILKDMASTWRNGIIKGALGNIQIMAKGLREEESLNYTISDKQQIFDKLKTYEEIESYTERIEIGGLISTGEETRIFYGEGIDPKTTRVTLPGIVEDVKEGSFIGDEEYEGAVLGEKLAEKLNLKIGDILMLTTNDKYGALNAIDIRVVGILHVRNDEESKRIVYIHIQNARNLVSYEENEISKVIVALKDSDKTVAVKNQITQDLPSEKVELYSWHDLATEFNQVQGLFNGISALLTLILLVLVLVSIMNSVLMSVFERTREIGTSMAIGSSRFQVLFIFIVESFFIGLIGVLIGVFLGTLLNHFIVLIGGIRLPPPPGGTESLVINPAVLMNNVIGISILVLIFSTIAGLYPANFAAKQRPVDCLRAN